MEIFDSHCHLDFPSFDDDREQVVRNCRAAGMVGLVVPGVSADTWDRLLEITRGDEILHPALGLHPLFLNKHEHAHLQKLERYIEEHHPIALGEIGLDLQVKEFDPNRQRELFEAQLELAHQHGLPVILHVRKAHDEVLERLRTAFVPGGIVHAFNGSEQQARRYMDLGFKLGFGGAMTYERARKLRRLVKVLPLGAFVLETDAPDMAPQNHRGQRNSPEYLCEILDAMAEVRGIDREELAWRTTDNARRVFGLAR